MVGRTNTGGGGSGATLTIMGVTGATVTASKNGKTYTRTINNSGTAVFKGLSTGTWTVTMSGNGQTATRTVEITADYSLTIDYFSATIAITYPANSTCVIKNSSGVQVESDTNAGTSAKMWTATVGATGTYTITATSTDGSGKTKSTTVSITTDGQSVSVTLSYVFELLKNGILATGYEFGFTNGSYSAGTGLSVSNGEGCGFCLKENCKVNVDNFTTMKIKVGESVRIANATSIGLYNGYNTGYIGYSESQNKTEWAKYGVVLTEMGTAIGIAKQKIKENTEYVYEITALTGDWAVKLSSHNSNMKITDITFE